MEFVNVLLLLFWFSFFRSSWTERDLGCFFLHLQWHFPMLAWNCWRYWNTREYQGVWEFDRSPMLMAPYLDANCRALQCKMLKLSAEMQVGKPKGSAKQHMSSVLQKAFRIWRIAWNQSFRERQQLLQPWQRRRPRHQNKCLWRRGLRAGWKEYHEADHAKQLVGGRRLGECCPGLLGWSKAGPTTPRWQPPSPVTNHDYPCDRKSMKPCEIETRHLAQIWLSSSHSNRWGGLGLPVVRFFKRSDFLVVLPGPAWWRFWTTMAPDRRMPGSPPC